jgi:hypothetical protein
VTGESMGRFGCLSEKGEKGGTKDKASIA